MGGTTEPIINALKESYSENAELARRGQDRRRRAARRNQQRGGNATPAAEPRVLGPSTLEVAVLDANRPRRAFRRITGAALESLLPKDLPESAAAAEGDGPD